MRKYLRDWDCDGVRVRTPSESFAFSQYSIEKIKKFPKETFLSLMLSDVHAAG